MSEAEKASQFQNREEIENALRAYGQGAGSLSLAEAALYMAAMDRDAVDLSPYTDHLQMLAEEMKQAAAQFRAAPDTITRLACLRAVVVERHGYVGDAQTYDSYQNMNLMDVIDRRKGLPVALGIICLHAASATNWKMEALTFPGHVVMRLHDELGHSLLTDPFERLKILEASDLRHLVKNHLGPHAELSATYYLPMEDRDILLRLQNNIKIRLIEAEDYLGAIKIVERMRWIKPDDKRLLFDAGILYAKTEQRQAAIQNLQAYVLAETDPVERYQAQALLNRLRSSLQ